MVIREMSREECLRVLAGARLARLACAHENQPYVVPVYLASEPESKPGIPAKVTDLATLATLPAVFGSSSSPPRSWQVQPGAADATACKTPPACGCTPFDAC